MKDLKHIRRFNESEELSKDTSSSISDVSGSKKSYYHLQESILLSPSRGTGPSNKEILSKYDKKDRYGWPGPNYSRGVVSSDNPLKDANTIAWIDSDTTEEERIKIANNYTNGNFERYPSLYQIVGPIETPYILSL